MRGTANSAGTTARDRAGSARNTGDGCPGMAPPPAGSPERSPAAPISPGPGARGRSRTSAAAPRASRPPRHHFLSPRSPCYGAGQLLHRLRRPTNAMAAPSAGPEFLARPKDVGCCRAGVWGRDGYLHTAERRGAGLLFAAARPGMPWPCSAQAGVCCGQMACRGASPARPNGLTASASRSSARGRPRSPSPTTSPRSATPARSSRRSRRREG